MRKPLPAFNLRSWIEDHQYLLQPPVGAEVLWNDSELQVIIIGGPNARRDFHVDPSDEFFFQLKGTMVLEYMDSEGNRQRQPIREGEVFLLPANTPHSPQRPANTVGLVVERLRRPGEPEAYEWYCENCNNRLYRIERQDSDLLKDLGAALKAFHANSELRTCSRCGVTQPVPDGPRI